MKLARIDHNRCGEHDATSYVWVADDMNAEELDDLCVRAKDAHLKAAHEAKNLDTPHPGHSPRFEAYPTKTVAEVAALHEARLTAWKAEHALRMQARKSFVDLLVQIGGGRVADFYQAEPAMETGVWWGHQHGTDIRYGETNPNEKDVQGSLAKPSES